MSYEDTGQGLFSAGWRSWVIRHLLTHPDHAPRYPKGHDFVLRGTADIGREHERWHDDRSTWRTPGVWRHEHERPWRVSVMKEKSMEKKTLELKVTVSGQDPDGTLATMNRETLRLHAGPYALKVTKVERADGQAFGLEAAFEEYWAECHCEGDDEEAEKSWAREAFLYGVKYGREHGKGS
jgi:hypothetical protein